MEHLLINDYNLTNRKADFKPLWKSVGFQRETGDFRNQCGIRKRLAGSWIPASEIVS